MERLHVGSEYVRGHLGILVQGFRGRLECLDRYIWSACAYVTLPHASDVIDKSMATDMLSPLCTFDDIVDFGMIERPRPYLSARWICHNV